MESIYFSRKTLLVTVMLFLPAVSYAKSPDWSAWLQSQLQQHPEITAAREQWQSSNASAEALEQPLYNPELSTELERNGDNNNYRASIQQTIDWWDRQGARGQQAVFLRSAAKAFYHQQLMEKTAQALAALTDWHAANRAAIIAQEQQQQLDALLNLVEKRQQAGDLGSIDAELTFLSLAQQLVQVANIEANLQKAEIQVRELLPQWSPEKGGIPEDFWPSGTTSVTNEELLTHPTVASAHARWMSLQQEVEATRRAAKAAPTFGVNAGRDGNESAVGLTFSIPLNVRNTFSAETRAATQTALEAEARFQAVYRKQRFGWQAAQAAWQRYQQQYQRWQSLVEGRVENSAQLLESQWRSGDLSTTDYLLALNQRAESLIAGIELQKQTRLALTEVLLQSGALTTATMPITAQTY